MIIVVLYKKASKLRFNVSNLTSRKRVMFKKVPYFRSIYSYYHFLEIFANSNSITSCS